MIAGDRGDALLQCALLLGAVMVVYWSCFMDHTDDGMPDDPTLDKWWKHSERREHARGHAARIDPGVELAIRTEAIGRLAASLDIPPEVLGMPGLADWQAARRLEEKRLGMTAVDVADHQRRIDRFLHPPAGPSLDIGIVHDPTLEP